MSRSSHRFVRHPLGSVLGAVCLLAACTEVTEVTSPPSDPDIPDVVIMDAEVLGEVDAPSASDLPEGDVPDHVAPPEDVVEACPGGFGCPCDVNDDCDSGWCVEGPDGAICTDTCENECPAGFSCKLVTGADAGTYICLYNHMTWCRPCDADSDCLDAQLPGLSHRCLPREDGSGSFCATECDFACPGGATCEEVVIDDVSLSLCPLPVEECACSVRAVEEGASTLCTSQNDWGTCEGTRLCTDEGLTDCDAATPAEEVCNDLDDDCDGVPDDPFVDKGSACDGEVDTDLCLDGVFECDAQGALVCSDDELSTLELCNDLDDDCDTEIDEDFSNKGLSCDGSDADMCADGTYICESNILVCDDDDAFISELCNDIDDDCDGQTDEEFPEKGAACDGPDDADICADGTWACTGDGGIICVDPEGGGVEICDGLDNDCDGDIPVDEIDVDGDGVLPCAGDCDEGDSAVFTGADERCNGVDDDCDGDTDEDYTDGTVAYVDLDGTEGLPLDAACGVGVCDGGVVVCGDDGLSLVCSTLDQVFIDTCDGQDNDCDGVTDEAYEPGGEVTYQDLDGTDGLALGDACGLGACEGGTVACTPDGIALTCSSLEEVVLDVCDGVDNDCDGVTDEDYQAGGVATYTDLDGTEGLVLGDPCGVGACGDGEVVCASDGLTLACSAAAGSVDICDGLDNDCDGATDEDYQAGGSLTYAGPDGSSGLALGDPCGAGVCAGGEVVCGPGGVALTCSTDDLIGTDLCDGEDNDCDGEVDEDYAAGGAVTYITLDGSAGLSLGSTCGVGGCLGGEVICKTDGTGLICSTNENATNDLCDGNDNDCDGTTDEDFMPGGTMLYTDLDGTSGLPLGAGCGAGACAGGSVVCSANGQSLVCSTFAAVSTDLCDGLDNDCDGALDEDFVAGGTITYTDLDGTAGLSLGASCGTGACGGGQIVCNANGTGLYCSTAASATMDVCDGVDNDCDGGVDENYTVGGSISYTDLDGTTGLPLGASCGTGACDGGSVVCAADGVTLVCSTAGSDSTDVCDGVDNDCDGSIDEDYVVGGTVTYSDLNGETGLVLGASCGAGACAGGQVTCAADGVTLTCSTEDTATTDICDWVDNDCDGSVDEDYAVGGLVTYSDPDGSGGLALGASCGSGACGGGAVVCAADGVTLTCSTGGAGAVDVCDGVDNDCDGVVDEDYVAGGSVTYTDLDGTTGLSLGASCGVGVCGGGEVICGADQASLVCSTAATASVDLCDGVDNDCDGAVDEDYTSGGSVTYSDPSGATGLAKGASCGVGACAGGQVICAESGFTLSCSTGANVAQEVCNGVDDDCDGAVNEGLVLANDVVALSDVGCVVNGLCGDPGVTTATCTGGVWTCDYTSPLYQPGAESSCDAIDNDCDGQVDENIVLHGAGEIASVGCKSSGVCADPEYNSAVCSGGDWSCLYSHPSYEGSFEVSCDGLDGDCDGATDEGLSPPLNSNQSGACQGSVQTCAGASGWQDDYAEVTTYGQPEVPNSDYFDENCDGVDGTAADAVFVAPSGVDASGCGAITSPCATLGTGLAEAIISGRDVYLRAGTYSEGAHAMDAEMVGIYGGYDSAWVRDDRNATAHKAIIVGTVVSGGHVQVFSLSGGADLTLADLFLEAPDATATVSAAGDRGASSHGVILMGSSLEAQRVTFIQGDGADGMDGALGTNVSTSAASAGSDGEDADSKWSACNDDDSGDGGSKGSNAACSGTAGGDGGDGGVMDSHCSFWAWETVLEAMPGDPGANASGVTSSGPGYRGSGGSLCGPGSDGQAGAVGNGSGGFGAASGGALSGGHWYGHSGGAGLLGQHGGGGGGGGGSGGCDENVSVTSGDSYGGGGGGGGAGGCRSTAGGQPGTGGGGSFGILAITSYVLTGGCVFNRGDGGDGGSGGAGGAGQPGGDPGLGGHAGGTTGAGGDGGAGGHGGHSGGGGGGAGGHSFGVFYYNSTMQEMAPGNSYTGGTAGSAGGGGAKPSGWSDGVTGGAGATGVKGTTGSCSAASGC